MSRRALAVIPVAAFIVALLAVPLPYYSESPGPAREVGPLIHVSGAQRYPSEGKFVMTSVSVLPLTVARLLRAWQDPAEGVIPESFLVFPGETQQHADQRSMSQMDQSKIDATTVVLGLLKDYPEAHGPGVLVESVSPECPADGHMFPGDLIERVNGRKIADPESFSRILDEIPPATPIVLRVFAGGETTQVKLTRAQCDPGSKRFLIGISTVANFPFEVSISSGDIGGPSAGSMFALGLYDLLTPGDLTGGRTIAGTGEIHEDGTVGEIGGVEEKVAAAKEIDADVFLVPDGNLAAARTVAGDLELVPMATFQDALDYLEKTG